MAQDPISLRRLQRRRDEYSRNKSAANLASLRAASTEFIKDLKNGKGSYSDNERKTALSVATQEYTKLVGENRTNPDPLLPQNSDSVIQSLLPSGNTTAKTAGTVIPELPDMPSPGSALNPVRRNGSKRPTIQSAPAGYRVGDQSAKPVLPASANSTDPEIITPSDQPSSARQSVSATRLPEITPTSADTGAAVPSGLPVSASSLWTKTVAGAVGAAAGAEGASGGVDWFGAAGDALGLIAGASGIKKLPTYQLPPEYQMYLNRVKDQSSQGLTPERLTAARQDLQNNFATSLAYSRGLTGGGGSASESAANGLDAAGRFNSARLNLAALDSDQQRQNLSAYGQSLGVPLSVDQGNFEREYNNTANTNNVNAQLIQRSAQSLANRPYENQNEDLYQKLFQATLLREQNAADAIKRRNELGVPK